MSRFDLATAGATALLAAALAGAHAQQQPLTAPPQPFVARADVNVTNKSPVPQTVAGTGVAPFQLLPNQVAELDMTTVPPPAPTARGSSVPVRFEYSVGQAPGPLCRGTIDMSLRTSPAPDGSYEVTNCIARSNGTDGANCQIAVSAQHAECRGGLAFQAR